MLGRGRNIRHIAIAAAGDHPRGRVLLRLYILPTTPDRLIVAEAIQGEGGAWACNRPNHTSGCGGDGGDGGDTAGKRTT